MFNPSLKIGQIINNNDLKSIFVCGQQGGMRRSKTTNTLVLVSDYTRGIYHDKWIGGVLHYTGVGTKGDQDINYLQNKTLNESKTNGVDLHLFVVMEPGEYAYCGRVELVSDPYTDTQPDEDGNSRLVWIFPLKPEHTDDVKKPALYEFEDMEDYQERGKNVDAEYAIYLEKKLTGQKSSLKGKRINHETFGEGTILKCKDGYIEVKFDKNGTKSLGYDLCIKAGKIEFI